MKAVLAAVLILALGGCALITRPPARAPGVANPGAWQTRQDRLTGFDVWSLQGRAATGKVLGFSGNLSWRQRGKRFDVRLSGPLGAGGFRAQGTLALVKIRTDKDTFYTNQPAELIAQTMGWRFPLNGLRYWVLGLPAPGQPAQVSVDEKGLLRDLHQAGWRLAYTSYQNADGLKLPRTIVLNNDDNTIKVVIDRWFDLDTTSN